MRRERRPILLLDVFQTGAAQAPRNHESPACLTFNVSDDAARVQDIVSAIAYASKTGHGADVFAEGDTWLWSMFAAAVSNTPVSLHLEHLPELKSDADYLAHFNVPGILHAGGVDVAGRLVKGTALTASK